MVVVAGCAGSGEPDDYDDTVQSNFIEACVASGEQNNQQEAALQSICECAYAVFSDPDDGIAYEDFKSFDDELRNDIDTAFPDAYAAVFADCIRGAAGEVDVDSSAG